MTAAPLAGRSVVVTRTRQQASRLVEQLTGLGASVIEFPVIAVEDPRDGGRALSNAADRLVAGAYGWVVCTSANGVTRLLSALGPRSAPPSVRWAAVGTGTAAAMTDRGVTPDLVPDVSVAEALAGAFPDVGPPAGRRPDPASTAVLFPRAETTRGALSSGLRAKGWQVDEVVAYRTVAGHPDPGSIAAAGRADAIAFTSSSTVNRSVDLLGADGIPPVVASIGPVTSTSARQAGLEVTVEASPHNLEGLVAALVEALGSTERDRQQAQQQQQ